ncbi:CheR family methyltransferase [Acetivibrio cellulolyticus]|uniref:CheR family methyltransferase n=1 Tax=Acetivibrio cellulolyticus TaxID=35830 RepID=UPI0001E2D0FE|nr:CheR family methyltransferase [Acetivibrio cellulolyticus]
MAFTYFFRDLQTLDMICEHALPSLKSRRYINIWDAGCAMGPEPYSLAIVIRERTGYMYFRNIKIHATDLDGSDLFGDIISNASYPWEQVERIPKDIFERYFVADEKEKHYRLVQEIRNAVDFKKHDLLSMKSPGSDFGLVLCKNVLLHFSEHQRIEVIKMFHSSLSEGGFLAMEQTQKLPEAVSHLFEPIVSHAQLYKKI